LQSDNAGAVFPAQGVTCLFAQLLVQLPCYVPEVGVAVLN